MACSSCGNANNRAGARYCMRCGSVLPAPPTTVLHSTASTANVEAGATVAGTLIRRAEMVNVQQATILQQAPPARRQDLHQLRAPVAVFTGRQAEIDRLVASLTPTNAAGAPLAAIRGLAGAGKTALALLVANRVKDTYPDAQIVLDLRGASATPLMPAEVLQAVIRAFEPEQVALPSDDLPALKARYLSLLSGKRALILADDARDEAHVGDLVPPAGCALLVTSRQRLHLPGTALVDLGPLPQAEAEALLLSIAARVGGAAPRLAELCGRLPLALHVSATQLARTPTPVARYIQQLAEEHSRLLAIPDPADPQRSVGATLTVSYNALPADAKAVLCQLGVFAGSLDREAARAVVDIVGGVDAVEEQIGLLYDRSLVDWDEPTDRFSLHDLVRAFAVGHLMDEEVVRLRHAQFYCEVAAAADTLFHHGGESTLAGLQFFDRERVNIDAGWAWAQQQAGETTDRLLLVYADASVKIGGLRYHKRRERIPQLRAALAAARRLGDRAGEGRALGGLGSAYSDLGEVRQAIGYHEQHLAIAREVGDRAGEGRALGGLGFAYSTLGEVRQAIGYHEQHLAIAREIGDRRGEADSSWNLGGLLLEQGEAERSLALMQVCVDLKRQMNDPDAEQHAATLKQIRGRIGDVGRKRGKPASLLQRWFGEKHGSD